MINIDSLASRIEEGLNAVASAYKFKFKIHTDAGAFEKAKKTPLEDEFFINCLLRAGESSVVPVQSMMIATQSAMLEICVPMFKEQDDAEVAQTFRALLDGYFSMYKVQEIDGYTISATYSLAGTGTLEARDGVGPSLTFYVSMEFGYIENGLNSQNCTFTLSYVKTENGIEQTVELPIPFTSAKITKTPQMQGDAFSNDSGVGKGINTSFTRTFQFQVPGMTNGIGATIVNELLGNDLNTTYTLAVKMDSIKEETYTVIFGATDVSLAGINNAGHEITFVEAAF